MTSTTRRALFVTFIAACAQNAAGPSAHADNDSPSIAPPTPAKTGVKPVDVHEQVWDASRATDGSCVAVPRFPRSSHLHDAELGLLHVSVAQVEVVDGDTTNGYCNFIEHHPWHASVQSGELACRVDKLQGTKCKQGAKMSQYCGKPSYCAPGVANRAGCQ